MIVNEGGNEGGFALVIGFSLARGLGGPRYGEDALKGWTTNEEALLGRDNEGRFVLVIGFPLAWGLGGPRHGEEASSGLDYRQRGAAGLWLSTIDCQPSTIFALRVD